MNPAGPSRPGRRSGLFRALAVAAAAVALTTLPGCFSDAAREPDTVSATRSELIFAARGFICLYRDGANPVDLLYVKDTANRAGFQVVFKIAEPEVIPEAVRNGWGDVAVGFTEADAKKYGLRTVPLPRTDGESPRNAADSVLLLRSADDLLDALLNPDKKTNPPVLP